MRITLLFCLSITFLFTNHMYAQRAKTKISPHYFSAEKGSKIPTDTLMPSSFNTGTEVLYTYVEGGYNFGVNKLKDKAIAQVYQVDDSYVVNGIALKVGAKAQVGTADTLLIFVYELDGAGTASSGPVNNAPKTIVRQLKVSVDQLNVSGLNVFLFPDSLIVEHDYAIGVDFSLIADDTIGFVSTTDGDALDTQLSWNKWSDGTWHTVLEPMNWNMDVDLGLFVVADMSSMDVAENKGMKNLQLSQNKPNPAINKTLIQYELKFDAKVVLEVYDMYGNIVLLIDKGDELAGQHSILLETEKLYSGTYYYSLKAGSERLTKKMIVAK